jgi:predicted 2-oxoglutarate/Fe(II)-dependent dioxygenase YbiX
MGHRSPYSNLAPNVVVHRRFLRPGFCAAISSEMSAATGTPATVHMDGRCQLRPDQRRTSAVDLAPSSFDRVVERLSELIPPLSSQFQLALAEVVGPQALTYCRGDFFCTHRDRADEQRDPEFLRRRLLSAVVFLNDWTPSSESEAGFSGGVLKLYPSATDPTFLGRCLPICAEAGALVVFPSEMFHEISAVTHGRRHSLVAFFSGSGAEVVARNGRTASTAAAV